MAGTRSDKTAILLAHISATRRKYADIHKTVRWGLTAIAALLGFIGFDGLAALRPFDLQKLLDAWYKTAGLLTVHLPRNLEDTAIPATIQIARFLLPGMAIYLSIVAYLRLARGRIRFFRLFRLRNHIIVLGSGIRGHMIAKQCRAHQHGKVVYIAEKEDNAALEDLNALGIIVVRGSGALAETYIRTDLKNARAVIVAGDNSMENIRACAAIRTVALAHRVSALAPLSVVVAIDSPEMGMLLGASFHGIRDHRIEYRLLDPSENIAQTLVGRLLPLLGSPDHVAAILLLGWAGPAAAVYRRLLRNGPPDFQLVLADRAAESAKTSLFAAAPGLSDLRGLRFITLDGSGDTILNPEIAEVLSTVPLGAIIISGESDESNFRNAIQLRRFARDRSVWSPPIFVRQQGSDVAFDALKELISAEAVDVSRIHPFGSLDEQYAAETLLFDREDILAKAVHESYRRKNTKAGKNTEQWETLLETYRTSNRLQAEHIDVKLAAARCRKVAAKGGTQQATFSWDADEIEHLAALEHWRWCVDRWLDGWVYDPQRQDALRKHDLLVPYDRLTDEIKDYDREAIRNLPQLLGLGGYTIKREELAIVTPADLAAADPAQAIAAEVAKIENEGAYAVVALSLADPPELALCTQLQERKLPVRLFIGGPFEALAAQLPTKALIDALDAADDILPNLIATAHATVTAD